MSADDIGDLASYNCVQVIPHWDAQRNSWSGGAYLETHLSCPKHLRNMADVDQWQLPKQAEGEHRYNSATVRRRLQEIHQAEAAKEATRAAARAMTPNPVSPPRAHKELLKDRDVKCANYKGQLFGYFERGKLVRPTFKIRQLRTEKRHHNGRILLEAIYECTLHHPNWSQRYIAKAATKGVAEGRAAAKALEMVRERASREASEQRKEMEHVLRRHSMHASSKSHMAEGGEVCKKRCTEPQITKPPTEFVQTLSLHHQVLALCQYVEPTLEELHARGALLQRITSVIASAWPLAQVSTFGSYATGLSTFASDIDMFVSGSPGSVQDLNELARALRTQPWAKRVEVRARAKVPVINMLDGLTGVDADITLTGQAEGAADFVDNHVRETPLFKPLVMVLKVILAQHSLNKPFEGGLGSFMLYVLLGRYLESVADMINPSQNAGVALLGFLRAFGMSGLWPKEIMIRAQGGASAVKVDFANVRRYKEIRDCFRTAYVALCGDKCGWLSRVVDANKLTHDRVQPLASAMGNMKRLPSTDSDRGEWARANGRGSNDNLRFDINLEQLKSQVDNFL